MMVEYGADQHTVGGMAISRTWEVVMNEPYDTWVERLWDVAEKGDDERAKKFVRELYEAAQEDLDKKRREAEFEREE
jgi:hypothetical protein